MYDLPALLEDGALLAELRASIHTGQPPIRLRDAKLKVTARCNLRCAFCPCWRRQPTEELNTAELVRVIDDLADLDCRKIHLSGGEPTLRADLPALIAYATQRGIKTVLTSNGTALTAELAQALLAAGLNSIAISLDGPTPELHDPLRGVKGAFKRAVHGLKLLRQAKKQTKAKTKIRLNTVLTRHNYHAYPDLLALAGELGVNDVIPLPVDEGGKSKNRLLPWQLQEFNEVIAPAAAELRARYHFADAAHLRYPFGQQKCELQQAAQAEYARGYYREHRYYVPWLHTLVSWDGDVWQCCMSRGKLPALGNVRQTPLREIFTGAAYTTLRQQFLTTRLPLCHRCDNFLSENRLLEPYLAAEQV